MTRRKKTTNSKRRTHTAHSTAVRTNRRRANFSAAPKRRNRRRNPFGVTRRRRRNPQIKGMVTMAAWAAIGAMATNIVAGFLPLRVSGWMGIGVRLGAAYLTGVVAQKFVSPANAQMIAVGGAAAAASEAINLAFGQIRGMTGSLFSSGDGVSGLEDISPAPDWYNNGTSYGSGYGLPPAPPKAGLGDVSAAPDYLYA